MTTIKAIILIAFVTLLSGCYPGISGKVVDGLTGNPLEGAVVLAQWTTTGGLPGLTHHTVYQIEESETDKEGKFSISGVYNPFVDPPKMVIYRKGYVPWRNDSDFMNPTWELYDNIIWKNGLTYKLKYLKEPYSKLRLDMFVGHGVIGASFNQTPIYSKIMSELSRESQIEVDKSKKLKAK
jgi:hypothetical protein